MKMLKRRDWGFEGVPVNRSKCLPDKTGESSLFPRAHRTEGKEWLQVVLCPSHLSTHMHTHAHVHPQTINKPQKLLKRKTS